MNRSTRMQPWWTGPALAALAGCLALLFSLLLHPLLDGSSRTVLAVGLGVAAASYLDHRWMSSRRRPLLLALLHGAGGAVGVWIAMLILS